LSCDSQGHWVAFSDSVKDVIGFILRHLLALIRNSQTMIGFVLV
jgi:hypothetical protein